MVMASDAAGKKIISPVIYTRNMFFIHCFIELWCYIFNYIQLRSCYMVIKNSRFDYILLFLIKVFFILFFCLVFITCEFFLPRVLAFDEERFNKEWAAWEAQGLVNYSVIQEHASNSTGGGKARIIVQDNIIIQKEAMDFWSLSELEMYPHSTPKIFGSVKTISDIYSMVNKRYESTLNGEGRNGLKIKIKYNKKYHYPEYIDIFYLTSDGSNTISISEFIPHLIIEE